MIALCFFSLLSVVVIKISSEISPKFRFLLIAACGTCLLFSFFHLVSPFLESLSLLFDTEGFEESFRLILKALGIAFLVSITASFCRDLGEGGIGDKLELCGKGAILALSLPILKKILDFIGELVS